jgi:DNA-binding transcriptional LysR family regulator
VDDVTLADLRALIAIAQHRSFRRAAEEIGVSRSALSHSLRALERRLDTRLLHRTTRSVAPTEAGAALLARVTPLLGDLDEALASTGRRSDELTGTLRINANEGGARWLLRHAIPAFVARHPRVAIDLVTEGRLVDIVAEGFDAGVRLIEAVPQDMIAVPFGGPTRFVAVAAPAHIERYGQPAIPEDLTKHPCIRQRLPSGRPYRWEFEKGGREVVVEVPGTLCLDNSALMVEAAEAGMGIAYVPEPYARDALAAGRLGIVLDDWSPTIPGACLYYASHRHVPAALRAFIDAIREGDPSRGAANDR